MKYLIALFVMLLGVSVNAEALLTLDSLRVAVMREQGLPDSGSTGVTVVKVNFNVNRAIQRVSEDFPAVEKIDTITYTAGGDEYAFSSDFVELAQVFKFADGVPQQGHVHNKKLFIFPKSLKTGDSMRVFYYALGTKLTSGTDTTDVLPGYREAVVVYANYLVAMLRTKYVKAQVYLQAYKEMKAGE